MTTRMTINGVSTCAEAGTEKYERFQSGIGRRRRTLVQYDYRHPIDRELFSCVKPTYFNSINFNSIMVQLKHSLNIRCRV